MVQGLANRLQQMEAQLWLNWGPLFLNFLPKIFLIFELKLEHFLGCSTNAQICGLKIMYKQFFHKYTDL